MMQVDNKQYFTAGIMNKKSFIAPYNTNEF